MQFKIYILLFALLLIFVFSCKPKEQTICKDGGWIKGYYVYPGEGHPEDVVIGAIDTVSKKSYTTNNFTKLNNFILKVPKGIYFVYAESEFVDTLHKPVRLKGYYTEYTRQGMTNNNASKKPLPVIVNCRDTTKNVIPGDFWSK